MKTIDNNKPMVLIFVTAMALYYLLPQAPDTFAYLTSRIESEEITFTYEPIQAEANIDQLNNDSIVYLTFSEFDIRDIDLSTIVLHYGVDTYVINPLEASKNHDQIVVDTNQERQVENWLRMNYPHETNFHLQISGEGDYKGAQIQFTSEDSIILVYVPEIPEGGFGPGGGGPALATPPEELLEEVTEELETELVPPETGNDPVTELPSEETAVGESDGEVTQDETKEAEGESVEQAEETEKPSQRTEETPESTETPSEEMSSNTDSDDEEQAGSGGDADHE